MFHRESSQPRDTSTLLLNSNKISTRLANLKLLAATTLPLFALSKEALTSSHPIESIEYEGPILAAGVRTHGGDVKFSQVLKPHAFAH